MSESSYATRLIENDWAKDARTIAAQLEREGQIPPSLELRVKSMINTLVRGVIEMLAEPSRVDLACSLAAPMRRLHAIIPDEDSKLDRPSDRDEVLLSFVEAADVIDRFAAGYSMWADTDPLTLLGWLRQELPVTQRSLASCLGVSIGSLQRWIGHHASPSRSNVARIRALARLVNELRYVAYGRARVQWLTRENPILAGQAPIAVLSDESRIAQLTKYLQNIRSL